MSRQDRIEVALGALNESCRECRDQDVHRQADFILWGKLLPPEALGPRCLDHAVERLGWQAIQHIGQWAVFDLRKVRRALTGERTADVASPA